MKRLLSLILGCCLIGGCGYTSSSLLPDNIKSIYVENFKNEIDPTREISNRRNSFTYTPGLENIITRSVIDGFIFDRHLTVEREGKADIVLKGSLVDLRQYPLSYSGDNVEELRMEIYVNLELVDNNTGITMWSEQKFMGYTDYTTAGPNSKSQGAASRDAVTDLAKRVVERTVEDW